MKEIKLDILAFGAHPDDVELGCGGTLAKEIHNGKKIGIIDLTRGELGTRVDVKTKNLKEQMAPKIWEVEIEENLISEEGFLEIDETNKMGSAPCRERCRSGGCP